MHRLIKKARSSTCHHKVAAMALDEKDNVIAVACNKRRFMHKGGGLHAEMVLMRRYGRVIYKILVVRVNNSGRLLPIDPCVACVEAAGKLGIKILRWRNHERLR